MSKLRPEKEYEKMLSFRFFRWLSGEKDPYLNEVEMQVQKPVVTEEETIQERMREKQMIHDKIYDMEQNKEIKWLSVFYKVVSLLFCATLLVLLLITVSYLPKTGNASNPDNNEVSERYIEAGMAETGVVNTVTGMILQYRGFDTFGETHVLFIATICVMVLLMVDDEKMKAAEEVNDRRFEPKNDVILQKVAFVLVPIVIMFGIYVVLNGHLSPGGGFSGGAMIGAGMILYLSAFGFQKTQNFFNEEVYKVVKVAALVIYAIIMSYYFFTGGNGLENIIPLGTPGNIISAGMILPINMLVGAEVACTMYAFYALFRRGGL